MHGAKEAAMSKTESFRLTFGGTTITDVAWGQAGPLIRNPRSRKVAVRAIE